MRLATGNIRNWAIHAAAMVNVPELEAKLSPPVQREGVPIQSNKTGAYRAVRSIKITRQGGVQQSQLISHFKRTLGLPLFLLEMDFATVRFEGTSFCIILSSDWGASAEEPTM